MGFFGDFIKDTKKQWNGVYGKPKMPPEEEIEYRREQGRLKSQRDFKESENKRKIENMRVANARKNFDRNVMGSLNNGWKSIGGFPKKPKFRF